MKKKNLKMSPIVKKTIMYLLNHFEDISKNIGLIIDNWIIETQYNISSRAREKIVSD